MTTETKTCGCGCGRPVNPGKRFVKGHFDREAHRRAVNTPEYKETQRRGSLGNAHKLGKKESEETRRRKSEAHSGKTLPESQVKKIAESNRGQKRSKETKTLLRKLALVSQKARWEGMTPEERYEATRVTMKNLPIDRNRNYDSGWHDSPKAGRVYYRSSYERRVFEAADQFDLVQTYVVEPFKIPYVDAEGVMRDYYPDLLLKTADGRSLLIEVKPRKRAFEMENIFKYEAGAVFAKEHGLEFHVWTEASVFNPMANLKAA